MKTRTNWQALLQEFEDNPDLYPTAKAFAEAKGFPYNTVKTSFKRAKAKRAEVLGGGAPSLNSEKGTKAQPKGTKKGTKGTKGTKAQSKGTAQKSEGSQQDNQEQDGPDNTKASAGDKKNDQPPHDVREGTKEKPLTVKQEKFIAGVIEGKTKHRAALDAGYKDGSVAYKIARHSKVEAEFAKSMHHIRRQSCVNRLNIIERIAQIAFSSIDEIVEIEEGTIKLREGVDFKNDGSALGLSKIKFKRKVSQTEVGEDVETELEVTGVDQIRALKELDRMLGFEDGSAFNYSEGAEDNTVEAIWEQFRTGKITAQDAWNLFDFYGVPCPKSIIDQAKAEYKIVLEEDMDDEQADALDYDKLEEEWQEYQVELQRQREKFIPQRKAELEKTRREYEAKHEQKAQTEASDGSEQQASSEEEDTPERQAG